MITHPDKPRAGYFHQLKRNVARSSVRRLFVLCLLAAIIATIAGLAVFHSPSAFAQSGTWSTKAPMLEAREQSASAAFGGLFYIFGGSSSTVPEVYDPLSNSWSTRAPDSTARCDMAAITYNGKIHVIGGWINCDFNSPTTVHRVYDPVANTWSSAASALVSRGETASGLIGGKFYLTGGGASFPGAFNQTEIYDPVTDTWSFGAPIPIAVRHPGSAVIAGKLYVVSGQDASNVYRPEVQIYDPVSNSWTYGAPIPTPRHSPLVGVIGGKLYAATGYNGSELTTLEIYDIASNSWTTGPSSTTPRWIGVSEVIDSKFYIAGGRTVGSGDTASLEVFTIEAPTPTPTPTPQVGPPQSWTSTLSMTHARFGHTATRLPDGRVLAVGGTDCSTGPLASAELYDPISSTWTPAASMSTARRGHTATLLPNGKVLVAGGFNNGSTLEGLASAELYDPVTDTWSGTNAMAVGRDAHTATLLVDGKVLVAGGESGFPQVFLTSAELYDPATGTWSSTGSLLQARDLHTALLLQNGKVLVAGGRNAGTVLDSAELYDATTQTWSSAANLNERRAIHTATLLSNGQVLVAGGFNTSLSTAISSAELYNPITNTWTPTASMGVSRYAHTATALLDGTVLVAGGFNGSYLVSAELYDPTSHLWMATGSLVGAREGHSATLLLSGDVLAAGGFSDSCLNSAELYNGPTPTPTPLSCVAPPSNMVSWWPGDGNANDIQDGNNGAAQNGATFAPGKVGQSFSFDGVDDFVEVQDSSNLNLAQALSIDAWVNPSVANQSGGIVEKTVGDVVNTQYSVFLEGGMAKFRLIIVPTVDHRTIQSDSLIPINSWTHIAGTWDGATMKLFINGVQQTETLAVTPPINSGVGPTLIGRLGSNIYHFAGHIDEVEIFNRALSQTEIQAIFNADSAGKCKAPPNNPPAVLCHNVTASAGPDCTANASIDNGSFDPDSGDTITLSQSPAGPYPLGDTVVTLTVTDNHGASSSCSATVHVDDNTPPSVTAPAPTSASADANCQAPIPNVIPGTTASDNCSAVTLTQSPTAGTLVGLGLHTITITAKDAANNTNTAVTTFTVNDNTPPSITCPSSIAVDATGPSGAMVNYPAPVAADNCSVPIVNCTLPSGSTFPIGSTTVVCTATDGSSNTSSSSFTVTVGAPRAIKQDVLTQMMSFRATVTNKQDRDKLDDAIKHLAKSVDPSLWTNDSHPNPKDGEKVFGEEKDAVNKLRDLIKDKHSNLPDATLRGFINRIVAADRILAQVAIIDAVGRGGEPKKIAKANEELGKGDSDAAAGKPDNAVEHYRSAWDQALKA